MTAPLTHQSSNVITDDHSAALFDPQLIRDWLSFIVHSVKRHPLLACACVFIIGGAAVSAAVVLPRHYETRTRLLSNQGLLSAANPYGVVGEYDGLRLARCARGRDDKCVAVVDRLVEGERAHDRVARCRR